MKVGLRKDLTSLFSTCLHLIENPGCDDQKEIDVRYIKDPNFNKSVKDLVECAGDIIEKHE